MTILEPKKELGGREERNCVGGMFQEVLIQVSEPRTQRIKEELSIGPSDWHPRQSGRHDRPTSKEWRCLRPGGSDGWGWGTGIVGYRMPPHQEGRRVTRSATRSGHVPIEEKNSSMWLVTGVSWGTRSLRFRMGFRGNRHVGNAGQSNDIHHLNHLAMGNLLIGVND